MTLTNATDQFGASRWLASSSLVGRWKIGNGVTFKPNATLSYYSETTDAFVNSLNVAIPSVNTSLGQVQLSPEVDYGFTTMEGTSVDFNLAPELIWNSATTSATGLGTLNPTAIGPTGLRGAIKAGATYRNAKGASLGLTGSYDGIGSSGYSAFTGQVIVKVPIN